VALAAAVDGSYRRLRAALTSSPPGLPSHLLADLRGVLDMVTGPGTDHAGRLAGVVDPLAGLAPLDYLGDRHRAGRRGRPPALRTERQALRCALAVLRDHFADVDGVGPPLRQQAVSRMDDLHEVNGILGLRGLLPPFTGWGA